MYRQPEVPAFEVGGASSIPAVNSIESAFAKRTALLTS
jgi:hypothetical protein